MDASPASTSSSSQELGLPGPPDGAACRSPNRALWQSLTHLQSENSELKVKVQSLERKSALTGAGGGSSKFLKMELEREKAEAEALQQQLAAALAATAVAQARGAACEAELDECREALQRAQQEQGRREREVADRDAQLAAAACELAAARERAQQAEAQVQGTRNKLQFCQAELRTAARQLEERGAALQARDREAAAAEAGLRAEVVRLEAACAQHAATIAELRQQQQQPPEQEGAGEQAPCSPESPVASLGAQSDGPGHENAAAAQLGTAGCGVAASPASVQPATIYNVMIGSPGEAAAAAEAEASQERLTGQVLELQDKLGALQAAYEALQHDYGTVTEQLAARQAEVTLARLSPESTALKQQVVALQEQVLSLQQELFRTQLEEAQAAPAAAGKEGRNLRRSFSRAASKIFRPLRRQRSQRSDATTPDGCGPDSRGSSVTEGGAESVCSAGGRGAPFGRSFSVRSASVHFNHSASVSPIAPSLLGTWEEGSPSLCAPSPGPGPASPRPEVEALLLRQQLAERAAAVAVLEVRLAEGARQQEALQEALLRQGEDLQAQLDEAREALERKQAELGQAQHSLQQLLEGPAALGSEVHVPTAGAEHVKCREAVHSLFQLVWRERLARQRAEAQLQLPPSRRSTQGEVDEATLERLEAEAQAADTLSDELQRAKGHQLQLQQRLEALQLQLAKQSALLESASRGRPSPRRGGQSPASRSPCKETISLHNSLRVAEQRAEEAGVRLAGAEREAAAAKRRERELNASLSQAAEWRKGAERRHEQRLDTWRKRCERERATACQMESRLRATLAAQQGLVSGLEVLQTLLQRREEAGRGSSPSRRTSHATPRRTSDTQEALKQLASLLRKCNDLHTQLQILSPQQSDCVPAAAASLPASPGEHHQLMSVTVGSGAGTGGGGGAGGSGGAQAVRQPGPEVWGFQAEPLSSPRQLDGQGIADVGGSSIRGGAEGTPGGWSAGEEQAPKALGEAQSLGQVLQAILGPGAGLGSDSWEGVPPVGGATLQRAEQGHWLAAAQAAEARCGSAAASVRPASSLSSIRSGLEAIDSPHMDSSQSRCAAGPGAAGTADLLEQPAAGPAILPGSAGTAPPAASAKHTSLLHTLASSGSSLEQPGHRRQLGLEASDECSPAVSPGRIPALQRSGAPTKSPLTAAAKPSSAAKLGGKGGSGSPRVRQLVGSLKSGFRRMGVACSDPHTRSGNNTPAKSAAGSARHSAAGGGEQPRSARGGTPVKPRKIWV